MLVIHVQIQVTAGCYDSDDIGLVQTGFNCQGGAAFQYHAVRSWLAPPNYSIEHNFIGSIFADAQVVEFCVCTIDAKHNPTVIACDDGHLDLIDEVTESSPFGARIAQCLRQSRSLVTIASGEYTGAVAVSNLVPVVALAIVLKWIIKS